MEYNSSYDFIVLGGGFTGCAAAIAAARQGLCVLLLESSGFLGGAASNCLIYPFMCYSTTVTAEDGTRSRHLLSRGIFTEIVEKLNARGGFVDETLKVILDEMTTEAGVNVLFHATLCGVNKNGAHIESLSAATKAGVLTFRGDYFADCTGDADLCTYAGVPTMLGREKDNLCQPMTLCFRVANVDKKEFFAHLKEMQGLYKEWQEAGKITNPRENILVFDHPIEGVLHFNTTRIVRLNPVDPFDVTKAEMEARRQVIELLEFFRANNCPGMEHARLVYTAPDIGVRESRMLLGEYVLNQDDLVACTKFDDAVAAGNYDIDIHNPEGSGTSHYYFPEGTWYTIPYRSLIPKASDCTNLLVGGRCISCTHEAQASIRIMPICCTTGEACGIAAAAAKKDGASVQNADIREIQRILTETGAYTGL